MECKIMTINTVLWTILSYKYPLCGKSWKCYRIEKTIILIFLWAEYSIDIDLHFHGKGCRRMKIYIAFLVQLMLWSVFYIAEWFSTKDHVEYKWIMFALFFYLSFLVAGKIVQSRKLTLFITSSSLCCFFAFKVLFEGVLQLI